MWQNDYVFRSNIYDIDVIHVKKKCTSHSIIKETHAVPNTKIKKGI